MSSEELHTSNTTAYNAVLHTSMVGSFGVSGKVPLFPHPQEPYNKLVLVKYKNEAVYFFLARLCDHPPAGAGIDAWSTVWIQPALTPGDYYPIQSDEFTIIYRLDSDDAIKAALSIIENNSNMKKIKETASQELQDLPINQVKAYFMEKHRQFIQYHMGQHNPLASANEDGVDESAVDEYNESSGLAQLAIVAANAANSSESNDANVPVNHGQVEPLRKRHNGSRRKPGDEQQKRRKPSTKPTSKVSITIQDFLSSCNLDMYTDVFIQQGFDDFGALLRQGEDYQKQMLELTGMMSKPGHVQRFLSGITEMKNA